jgi:hypothetical protein
VSIPKSPNKALDEQALMTELWDPQLKDDLRRYIQFVFPWGKPNTPLYRFKEPRKWQIEKFEAMTDHIKQNRERMSLGLMPKVFQDATVSGRGPGKSAFVGMTNLWFMSTRLGGSCINTANTEDQLKSKTWAELGKWHTMSINVHWFDKLALSLRPAPWFEHALKNQLKIDTGYYYSIAQLWSEEKPDAFAGAHNMNGMLVVFDEASGIPRPIWTVTEGFFTEPIADRFWFVFSNGRRNTGQFFECFHKDRNYWRGTHIDSRTVEGVDKNKLQEIVDKYGEDSDEARIEVKGMFPRQGDQQFISRDIVENAESRAVEKDAYAPLIMGVDPARYGSDCTVIRFRQGRDARSIPAITMKGADNMQVANTVASWITKCNPDAVCIDVGNGSGIIDRLREMGFKVHEVAFGKSSPEQEWANFRTYMWAQMREWLGGGCIDAHMELRTDLTAPEYRFMSGSDKLRLETKEELKARGFASPDHGDALALTFAIKVARRDLFASKRGRGAAPDRQARDVDYPLFG